MTRAIRLDEAKQELPRAPLFAWTVNALPDEIDNCAAAGMDELLVKPTGMSQLQAVLAKWLPAAAVLAWIPDQVRDDNPSAVMTPAVITPAVMTPAVIADSIRNPLLPPPVDVSVLSALVGDDLATIAEFLQDIAALTKTC